MNRRIYLSAPDVRGKEEEYVLSAIRSNWIAPSGPDLEQFEFEIAKACETEHAVGLSSGTAALHLSLLGIGVAEGDVVLVPTMTFVPTANVVRYVGATPVFIDIDTDTWAIDSELVSKEISRLALEGIVPSAVISVDLYGQCADYDKLATVLDEFDIPLIEDAAEALGARWGGRNAGSFGRAGAISFNGNKIITASGGGMLVTDDEQIADRARKLATQARDDAPHYQHSEIGYNYRMSNLLAAFGRAQLESLDQRIEIRRSIAEKYSHELSRYPGVSFMPIPQASEPNWWLSCVLIDSQIAGTNREEVRLFLDSQNVESRPLWKPMHLQPLYKNYRSRLNGTSEQVFEQGLCLPSGSGMSEEEFSFVLDLLHQHFEKVAI